MANGERLKLFGDGVPEKIRDCFFKPVVKTVLKCLKEQKVVLNCYLSV